MKNDYLDTEPPTATATAPPQPHLFPKLHPHFPTTATTSPTQTLTPPPPPADGATIEVVRRPRGRPPGSKNKPKPPLVITQDPDPTSLLMAPYVLEIPPRNDIVESVTRFCRRNGLSLLLLSASGPIFNFSLSQPSTSPSSSTVTFHGRFEMLSLSATFLGEGSRKVGDGVVVTVAGPQGQIVGGKVVGPLVAAGTVVVVAVSFNGPSFHRLGDEGENEVDSEDDTRDGRGKDNAAATQTPPQQPQPGEGYGSSRLEGTESMFWGHAHSLPGRQAPRQPPPPPPF